MSENFEQNSAKAVVDTDGARKKRHRRTHKSGYAVTDEVLLYRLADAGLLNKLHGVHNRSGGRVFYFDRDPEVQNIVDQEVIRLSSIHTPSSTGIKTIA